MSPSVALASALLFLGLERGPTLDASVFIAIADFMNSGLVPYVDVFDHKPPGIYLIFAALGGLMPSIDPWFRAWAVTLAATVGTLVVLARLSPIDWRGLPAGLGLIATVPVLAGHFFALNGGYTESVAVLPLTAAFALTLARRPDRRALLIAGLLCGLALAVTAQALPAVVAIVASYSVRQRDWQGPSLIVGAAGGSIAVIIAWLIFNGAWEGAWSQIVIYNAEYGQANADGAPRSLFWLAASGILTLPLLLAVLSRLARARSAALSSTDATAALWLALWVIWTVLQRNYFPHYAIMVAPALFILAAGGFSLMLGGPAGRKARSFAVSFILGFVLIGVVVGEAFPGLGRPASLDRTVERLARQQGSGLFVWGSEPSIYTATARLPATKYIYMAPLLLESEGTAGRIQDALHELERSLPEFIVDASINPGAIGAPPLFGEIESTDTSARALDPLRTFIADHYQVVATAGHWKIYQAN